MQIKKVEEINTRVPIKDSMTEDERISVCVTAILNQLLNEGHFVQKSVYRLRWFGGWCAGISLMGLLESIKGLITHFTVFGLVWAIICELAIVILCIDYKKGYKGEVSITTIAVTRTDEMDKDGGRVAE